MLSTVWHRNSIGTSKSKYFRTALARYPNESYYRTELELIQNKQALFNTAVAHARALETEGKFEQAIAEWKNLATVYPAISFASG